MKMVKVTETGAASGVQRFSFQISVEDRSRYEGDFIRGPEWKRLIEAFDKQLGAQCVMSDSFLNFILQRW